MKKLFLFTVNYPFSHGEHLLELETQHLLKKFDAITIICSDTSSIQNYEIDDNIQVIRKAFRLSPFEKKTSLFCFFTIQFWIELFTIITVYRKIPTLSIIYSILLSIKQAKKVQNFLEKEIIPKEIYSNLFFYSWWTLPSTLGMVFTKTNNPTIKIITKAHATDLYFERHKNNYLPFRKYIYSKMDRTICISNNGKTYIEKNINGNKINDNIIIRRLGIVNRFKYKEIVSNNEIKTIISCSNLIPLKRIELIIESLSLINDIKINWIHFGRGEEKENLMLLADNLLSPKENISYSFSGYIMNKELMSFYNNNYIDLFINVSEYEGIPLTLMEVMSFGIPTIATNVGGVNELVNKKNGILLDKNITSLYLSTILIDYLSLTSDCQKQYRMSARKTWEEKYNSDSNFEILAKTISSL